MIFHWNCLSKEDVSVQADLSFKVYPSCHARGSCMIFVLSFFYKYIFIIFIIIINIIFAHGADRQEKEGSLCAD